MMIKERERALVKKKPLKKEVLSNTYTHTHTRERRREKINANHYICMIRIMKQKTQVK
jgi:hypothetical protein